MEERTDVMALKTRKSKGVFFKWCVTILTASLCVIIPAVYVWLYRERDEAVAIYGADVPADLAALPKSIERVLLISVDGWPTQAEVVYVQDPSESGVTPVADEFKAETVSNDMFNALQRRGITVEQMEIDQAPPLQAVKAAQDLVVFIYPARNQQLPWKLSAYFDTQVEPLIARRKKDEIDIPVVGMVLGNTEADTVACMDHFRNLTAFNQLELLTQTAITPDLEIFERYRLAVDTAEIIRTTPR